MQISPAPYAARLTVDYPAQLDRLTTLLRLIWIVPIAVVLGLLTGGGSDGLTTGSGERVVSTGGGISAGLFVATALLLVSRVRYPRWVVRLRPRADALRRARRGVLRPPHRPVPVDRRRAVGAPRARVPRGRARPQPLAAAREVAARHPALPRARRAVAGCAARGRRGVVRDPRERAVPAGAFRLRGGGRPVEPARRRLRLPAGHRPLPAVQPQLTDRAAAPAPRK